MVHRLVTLIVSTLLAAAPALAGQGGTGASRPRAAGGPAAIAGPPPPVPPEVVARDEAGRVTVRAARIQQPLRIDGNLDEAIYATPSISDFVQIEPDWGKRATEKTEVWIAFDDDNVYVGFRCWQPGRQIATEMRRDNRNILQEDKVEILLDTFYDRRNGLAFLINPIGGRMDAQISNERSVNTDWNPVWNLAVGRFEGGWTAEAAIPFKSLRYRPTRTQVWGLNFNRRTRAKNEASYLTLMPRSRAGNPGASFQFSQAATVVGIEAPPLARNIDVKPYVTSSLTTDNNASPRIANDPHGDIGIDAKLAVTQGLAADLTYNTDFAQVEADEQQVNLTRFSLFFPEKREFFLENQGLFAFGGIASNMGVGDAPILFYSRRIGLDRSRVVPIQVGGRLTGTVGRYGVGAIDIQTEDVAGTSTRATNFSVVRVRRDILRRSSIGLIATGRSVSQSGAGRNLAYGADVTLAFFSNLQINAYWARTENQGVSKDNISYRGQLDYNGDRYGVQAERLVVGSSFNPEVGFARRTDIRKTFGQLRFSPRPKASTLVRKYLWTASAGYFENGAGRKDFRTGDADFQIEFQNSDRFDLGYLATYEYLPTPFKIATGVTLPAGGYDYAISRIGYNFGQQRKASGNVNVERGTFYNGHRTTFSLASGRVALSPQFTVEPTYSINRVNLVQGAFTTHLAGSRVTYTVTPLMFVSSLLQYNSGAHAMSANVRLRWEYRPGSELFVVYNEERDTLTPRFPTLTNRALIFKINRLFRF